jgi:hypothetical protein
MWDDELQRRHKRRDNLYEVRILLNEAARIAVIALERCFKNPDSRFNALTRDAIRGFAGAKASKNARNIARGVDDP